MAAPHEASALAVALVAALAVKVVIYTIIIIIELLSLDIIECTYQGLPTCRKSLNTSWVANTVHCKSRVSNIPLGPNLIVLIDVGGCYWHI